MAVHTVPQDVETDDKILGPFNLRQFIYLLVAAAFCGIGYLLFRLFAPLIIIVVPPVAILLVLALPLKKDQPMETYLAARISFIFKNNRRIWTPGQSETTIEITAPKKEEVDLGKGLSRAEVSKRLSFLADIVDTEGYAIKNSSPNLPFNQEVYAEAESITDMYDADRSQSVNQNLANNNAQNREALVSQMQQAISNNTAMKPVVGVAPQNDYFTSAPAGQAPISTAPVDSAPIAPAVPDYEAAPFNPEPLEQAPVLPEIPSYYSETQPITTAQPQNTSQAVSFETPAEAQAQEEPIQQSNPNMVNLANNTDLSIETIAKEANRITEKQEKANQEPQNGEVYVSLH